MRIKLYILAVLLLAFTVMGATTRYVGDHIGRHYGNGSWLTNLPAAKTFNIETFGALGNGVTDATLSIRAAVTAAATNGGTVFVPYGRFAISNVIWLSNNVSLVGLDRFSSVLIQTNSAVGVSLVMISNVTGSSVCNVQLHGNARARGLGADGEEYCGIHVWNATNVVVDGVRFYDVNKDGLNCDGNVQNLIVRNSDFESCGNTGLGSQCIGMQVIGCSFKDCGWTQKFTGAHPGGIGDVSSTDYLISGCRFENNYINLLKIGTGYGSIIGNNFICTNTAACNSTNILLRGSGHNKVIGNFFHYGFGMVVETNVGWLNLDNIDIENNTFYVSDGIKIDGGTNIRIKNNQINTTATVAGHSRRAIWLTNVNDAGIVIADNRIHAGLDGIFAFTDPHRRMVIRGNIISNATPYGIRLGFVDYSTISDNVLYPGVSAYFASGQEAMFSGNSFRGASVTVAGVTNSTFTGNYINNLVYGGIGSNKTNTFANNTINLISFIVSGGDLYGSGVWFNNFATNGALPTLSGMSNYWDRGSISYGSMIISTNRIIPLLEDIYTNEWEFNYVAVKGNITANTNDGQWGFTNIVAGYYDISHTHSFDGNTGDIYECAVFTNTVECTLVEFMRSTSASSTYGSSAAHGIIWLPANTYVELKLQNTANANDPTWLKGSFKIVGPY